MLRNPSRHTRARARARDKRATVPENLDFFPEGRQRLGVQVLLVQHLHRYILRPRAALVYRAERSVAEDLNLLDLIRTDLRRAVAGLGGLRRSSIEMRDTQ